jgi:hypothetical protein
MEHVDNDVENDQGQAPDPASVPVGQAGSPAETGSRASKSESAGEDRSSHMNVEVQRLPSVAECRWRHQRCRSKCFLPQVPAVEARELGRSGGSRGARNESFIDLAKERTVHTAVT